jgi:hypothetical protein
VHVKYPEGHPARPASAKKDMLVKTAVIGKTRLAKQDIAILILAAATREIANTGDVDEKIDFSQSRAPQC